MFNNLMRSISQKFDKGPGQNEPPGSCSGEQDRTEDGFLLVGDTASERTTVRAQNFRTNEIDAPPCYRDVSADQQLPSYTDYRSNIGSYKSPTIDVTQHPAISHGNPTQNPAIAHGNPTQTGTPTINTGYGYQQESPENQSAGSENLNSNRTAISDIPFHLGCGIGSCTLLNDIKMNNLLMQRTFDFSSYEYDFTTELSFLREHEAFEGDVAMDTSS